MRTELLMVAAMFVAACGNDNAAPSDTPLEASYENVVEKVLGPRCTFSSCHASPTKAAKLDLTAPKACEMLVNKSSCLFPDRKRIVPGHPEDSFFFHKLTGQGMDEKPTGDCGLGSSVTNVQMPYGAEALPDDELALVHAWIAAGAPCTGGKIGPALTVTTARPAPVAGETIRVDIALSEPSDSDQVIVLSSDLTALATPAAIVVPAATTLVHFNAYAMRPTSRQAIHAKLADSTADLVVRVTGLEVAEVLGSPADGDDQLQWVKLKNTSSLPLDLAGYQFKSGQGNYDMVSVDLAGTIPAGGCIVVGGPLKTAANGFPTFAQAVDFSPNLPHAPDQAAGFAVFDSTVAPLDGVSTPIDAMLVGPATGHFLDADGTDSAPHCATPTTGMSALRTGASSCMQATMQPNACQ